MKIFALALVTFAFAGLGMAQNCQSKPQFPCGVTVIGDTKVVAHNDDDNCTFTVPEPEIVSIRCTGLHDARETIEVAFLAGQCKDGSFINAGIIHWRICRAADSTTKFSWDIAAGNVERTGTLF